jgi:1-acyl-sn-glycerol-3-phosphate acyltransferase
MDRSDMKQSTKIIIEGIRQLKEGTNMVVFPEGTRSKGGPVHEFKAGSFKLATKSKAVVVPLTIDGTYKIMEANGNRIKPAEVNLYIHKPIITAELTKEETAELPARVEKIILSALPEYKDKN